MSTVRKVYNQVQDRDRFLKVLGRRGSNELKKWFRTLDRSNPNKMGGRRSHFWRQVANSVSNQPDVNGLRATISIAHPVIAHKAGVGPAKGLIRKKEKQWLTIPVVPEAYDRSAAEFEEETGKELTFVPSKKDKATAFLAVITLRQTNHDDHNDSSKRSKQSSDFQLIFVLKKRVQQKPDPNALPSDKAWAKALNESARDYLSLERERLSDEGEQ